MYVQWIAKLCVDSIDNDVRYHRESIKFSIKSLYFKYDYRWLLHTILQGSVLYVKLLMVFSFTASTFNARYIDFDGDDTNCLTIESCNSCLVLTFWSLFEFELFLGLIENIFLVYSTDAKQVEEGSHVFSNLRGFKRSLFSEVIRLYSSLS